MLCRGIRILTSSNPWKHLPSNLPCTRITTLVHAILPMHDIGSTNALTNAWPFKIDMVEAFESQRIEVCSADVKPTFPGTRYFSTHGAAGISRRHHSDSNRRVVRDWKGKCEGERGVHRKENSHSRQCLFSDTINNQQINRTSLN